MRIEVLYMDRYNLEAWGPLRYAQETDAGFDLRCTEDVTLSFGEVTTVGTGVRLKIPKGYHVEIRSRSGLAAKDGVFIVNSPGTIDEDYTGEIKLVLSKVTKGDCSYPRGSRMAQAVLMKHKKASLKKTDVIEEPKGKRNSNGFGSTGKT